MDPLLGLHIINEEGIDQCPEKHGQCDAPEHDGTIDIPQRNHLPLDCDYSKKRKHFKPLARENLKLEVAGDFRSFHQETDPGKENRHIDGIHHVPLIPPRTSKVGRGVGLQDGLPLNDPVM